MAETLLHSRRRCNSFVCALDFRCNLLCRCLYTSTWLHWRRSGLHLPTSTSTVTHYLWMQEKPVMFRRYTTLHGLITVAAFSVAAVWIAISASRHSTAKRNCEQKFFTATSNLTSEGETMCEIFPWVDIGLMGGLWALLLISQVCYLAVVFCTI
jgi:hypothetical protein